MALALVAAIELISPMVSPLSPVPLALVTVALLDGVEAGIVRGRGIPLLSRGFLVARVFIWAAVRRAAGPAAAGPLVALLLETPLSLLRDPQAGGRWAAGLGVLGCLFATAGTASAPGGIETAAIIGFFALTAFLTARFGAAWAHRENTLDAARLALRARISLLDDELGLFRESMSCGLLILDDLGRVEAANGGATRLLGAAATELLHRSWSEVLPLDAAGRRALLGVLCDGEAQRGVQLLLTRAASPPIACVGDFWASRDVAGVRVHVRLETVRDQAESPDRLRELGESVACVAHQIRNSLQSLEGRAAFSGIGGDTTGSGAHADVFGSLRDLADDLLALAGTRTVRAERLSIHSILGTAALLARRAPGAARIDFSVPDVCVLAPRGPLVHALFNLLDNACRATHAGHIVRVRLRCDGPAFHIDIEDDGPGFVGEAPILRSRSTTSGGVGLGLVAARRYLAACGGEVRFLSREGGGTVCRVRMMSAPEPTGGLHAEQKEG